MSFHRGSVRLLSSSVGISLLAFLIPSCRGRYSSIPNHLNFDDVLNFDNILTIFYCSGMRQAESHCPSSSRLPFLTSTTFTPSSRSHAGCLKKGRAMAVIRSRALRGRSGCSLLGRGVEVQPRGGLSFECPELFCRTSPALAWQLPRLLDTVVRLQGRREVLRGREAQAGHCKLCAFMHQGRCANEI